MAARGNSPRIPRVRLQRGAFKVDAAIRAVRRPDCGATVAYLGTVRSTPHGGGRTPVRRLEYEAFEKMAVAKLTRVRADALARFEVKELILHHRLGNFQVGEPVVMCVASAPHREAALDAVRFAIAEMKQIVPIWKKEVFRGGRQRWVVGEMRPLEVVRRSKRSR